MSAGVKMPLSPMTMRSLGMFGASASVVGGFFLFSGQSDFVTASIEPLVIGRDNQLQRLASVSGLEPNLGFSCVSPDGRFFYLNASDQPLGGRLRVFQIDPLNGGLQALSSFETGIDDLRQLAVSLDGNRLFCAGFGGQVLGYQLDPSDGHVMGQLPGFPISLPRGVGSPWSLNVAADGSGLSVGTTEGRILWEDVSQNSRGSGWSALLPELTQRSFIGGLSNDACVEHLYVRLSDGKLLNRGIGDWTDEELQQLCERYNICRIIARTPETYSRLKRWSAAKVLADFPASGGNLFAVDRRATYFLRGRGTITQLDWKRVAIADVEPDETGVVVLSLHHHANWRATPGYVTIERDVDVNDPISMLRLRIPSSVARITLTWRED